MKYAIINTTDRPYRRHVVEIIDGKAYYMCRDEEPHLKDHDGMEISSRTTAIEEFGIDVEEQNGLVQFTRTGPSTAKYEDGRIRMWQGEDAFTLAKVKFRVQSKIGRPRPDLFKIDGSTFIKQSMSAQTMVNEATEKLIRQWQDEGKRVTRYGDMVLVEE